jgi:fluoroquinolone resistance protein
MFETSEDFQDQIFESLDGKALVLSDRSFESCSFTDCNFSAAQFKNCKFIDCVFKNCDLSNIQVKGSTFRSVNFHGAKIVGVVWPQLSAAIHLEFHACNLDYTNLSEANLQKSDFAGARFNKSNLEKTDFRGALNYSIRPDSNRLKKAKFSLPEATLLLYGLDIVLQD